MSPVFRVAPGDLDEAELRKLADAAAEKVREAIMSSGGVVEATFERAIEEATGEDGIGIAFRPVDAYTIRIETAGGAAYIRADGTREPFLGGPSREPLFPRDRP